MTDYTELKARAEATKGWAMTHCWQSEEFPDDWEVGRIDEDDNRYPVMVIDTAEYGQPESAPVLARYYAAANPTAILELIAEVERLRADAERWQLTVVANTDLAFTEAMEPHQDALMADSSEIETPQAMNAQMDRILQVARANNLWPWNPKGGAA